MTVVKDLQTEAWNAVRELSPFAGDLIGSEGFLLANNSVPVFGYKARLTKRISHILKESKGSWITWRGDYGESFLHHVMMFAPDVENVLIKRTEFNAMKCPDNGCLDEYGRSLLAWWIAGREMESLGSSSIIYLAEKNPTFKDAWPTTDAGWWKLSIEKSTIRGQIHEPKLDKIISEDFVEKIRVFIEDDPENKSGFSNLSSILRDIHKRMDSSNLVWLSKSLRLNSFNDTKMPVGWNEKVTEMLASLSCKVVGMDSSPWAKLARHESAHGFKNDFSKSVNTSFAKTSLSLMLQNPRVPEKDLIVNVLDMLDETNSLQPTIDLCSKAFSLDGSKIYERVVAPWERENLIKMNAVVRSTKSARAVL